MGLGLGIILLVVGAILSFGVSDRISGIDLGVIGYILMAAGALSLIIGLVMQNQRSNTSHREVIDRRDDVDVRDRRIQD